MLATWQRIRGHAPCDLWPPTNLTRLRSADRGLLALVLMWAWGVYTVHTACPAVPHRTGFPASRVQVRMSVRAATPRPGSDQSGRLPSIRLHSLLCPTPLPGVGPWGGPHTSQQSPKTGREEPGSQIQGFNHNWAERVSGFVLFEYSEEQSP